MPLTAFKFPFRKNVDEGVSDAWLAFSMAFKRKSRGISELRLSGEKDDGLCRVRLGGDGNTAKPRAHVHDINTLTRTAIRGRQLCLGQQMSFVDRTRGRLGADIDDHDLRRHAEAHRQPRYAQTPGYDHVPPTLDDMPVGEALSVG